MFLSEPYFLSEKFRNFGLLKMRLYALTDTYLYEYQMVN